MRIIAGQLGGRIFDSPGGHRTHPMSDKIRGALFNTLGDISGFSVLDAFAGSGALSFEAISRGANHALAIDGDRLAQQTIGENIKTLGLRSSISLVKANAQSWLRTTTETFDLILCDPPYDNPQIPLLASLAERAKPGGVVVLSLSPDTEFYLPDTEYVLLDSKNYGDAQLFFYRKT